MGHNNTKGNRKFIKGRYTANAAKGERLVSSEFQLTFAGHEDISVLVRTSQIPEMTREDVEELLHHDEIIQCLHAAPLWRYMARYPF